MQPNEPSSSDPHQPYGQQPAYGDQPGQQPAYGQPPAYGQQPAQPGQYAQSGQFAQPGQYAQPASSAMPGVVKWGLGIQWVGVAFGAFALILGLIGLLAVAGSGDAAVAGFVGIMLAVAALILAVQVVVLIFATKGRNWARIALAVLAILGIVISLASGQGLNLGSAISILSVALLFMPEATAWYRARSPQR